MTTNVVIGYSPTDFFYVKASEMSEPIDNEYCGNLDISNPQWDISCNTNNYALGGDINKFQCNYKELCKNKNNAELLSKLQTNHSGSDQNYLDKKYTYNYLLTTSFNLGIGILTLIGFIIKYRNI